LLEVPSFKKGTINIGDRQRGRLQAESVINCEPARDSIAYALAQLYSVGFQASLQKITNPYGEGGASEAVVSTIRAVSFDRILKKRFYDIVKICG
jgi:GDP/UDP-N,N'-diacetylbacillosamine 2-epimerase (hydrolysing)